MTQNEQFNEALKYAQERGFGQNIKYDEDRGQFYCSDNHGGFVIPSLLEIIYAKDRAFLKSMFGKKLTYCKSCGVEKNYEHWLSCKYEEDEKDFYHAWQWRGQQMFISNDEIGYLYNFITEGIPIY